MKIHFEKKYAVFSILMIWFLCVPFLEMIFKPFEVTTLNGYVEPLPKMPALNIISYFNKDLQNWTEKYLYENFGFRAEIIKTFNQISFSLFKEVHNKFLQIYMTPEKGLYSNLSINQLNADVQYYESQRERFIEEAQKLQKVQDILSKMGKYFLVIESTSKAYMYPDDIADKYLILNPSLLNKKQAKFGNFFHGNFIDAKDEFELLNKKGIITHPYSGLHWNLTAGCKTMEKAFQKAHQAFYELPEIRCNKLTDFIPPLNDVDFDGLSLLNLWKNESLIKNSNHPQEVKLIQYSEKKPKIVIIGDSFSNQLIYSINFSHAYSSLIFSSYFQTREIYNHLNEHFDYSNSDSMKNQEEIFKDIMGADIIILEAVDYNLSSRLSYGFSDYFLNKFKVN